MVAVRMVQVALNQIVDVVAVGNGLVAAAVTVPVALVVHAAIVVGRAAGRVGAANGQMMFLDAGGPHVVQMAVVQVIDMALVLNGHMAAIDAMLMIVARVMRMRGSQG